MRVTFVVTILDTAGGARVVLDYAALLHARGHQVTIVEHSLPRRTVRQRIDDLIRWWRLVHPKHEQGFKFKRVDISKQGWEDEFPNADIVIATWWLSCECVALLPSGKGKKVHFVQDHEVFFKAHVDRIRASIRLIPTKVVVSSWLLGVMREEYGLADVRVAQNGVDTARFLFFERPTNSHPLVGTVYSPTERKNSSMALEAVRLARERLPNLRLLTFATVRRPRELQGADWAVHHQLPARDLIPLIYGSCDVWLFSSQSEGFGLPILEALACGTPVIATRAGAAPDLIDKGNGSLVATSPEVMADEIIRICKMPPDRWRQLSEQARRTAERNGLAAAGKRFEEALEAICAQ